MLRLACLIFGGGMLGLATICGTTFLQTRGRVVSTGAMATAPLSQRRETASKSR